MTSACLKDFMLVGNGNALDATGVKVRLGCKLGQIPAYVVSPEATAAGLQVQPSPNPSTRSTTARSACWWKSTRT